MSWGTTSKEVTDTSFFQEVPTIIKKFRINFIWCIGMISMIMVFAGLGPVGKLIPYDWRITEFVIIWPMANIVSCHFFVTVSTQSRTNAVYILDRQRLFICLFLSLLALPLGALSLIHKYMYEGNVLAGAAQAFCLAWNTDLSEAVKQ